MERCVDATSLSIKLIKAWNCINIRDRVIAVRKLPHLYPKLKKPSDVLCMPFDGRSKFCSPNSFSNSLQCQRFRKNQRACRRMAIIRAHRNRIKNNQRFPRYTYRVHGIIVPLSWVPWIRHWRGKRVPCCVFHANESRRSNQRSVIGLNSA